MFNLILKDLKYQRTNAISIFIIMLVIFFFHDQLNIYGMYFLISFSAVFIIIEAIQRIEGFRKVNNITNSLPVKRKNIVISIYAELILVQVFIMLIYCGLSYILGYNLKIIKLDKLLTGFEFITVVMSINLFVEFAINYKIAGLASTLLYGFIFGASFSFFIGNLEDNLDFIYGTINFFNINYFKLEILIFVSVILIFIMSMLLSIKFYEKKDI
ncbi:ABC-2 transporter permease [Clostridium fermenticellae]|uniref:ABC-2 transporter permease n=1 Tax=Clostridium fermenticellae TaxID=2068654 RepID=A0A386H2Q9_9CLOT|nr:ABC-2 transporter permease [Clostridium fermenticellae]AYD39979.1 ABC-2 transporter permease [Clostridium fermenticellae]